MIVHRGAIIRAADEYRVPATYSYRQHVQEGGLTSYGAERSTFSGALHLTSIAF